MGVIRAAGGACAVARAAARATTAVSCQSTLQTPCNQIIGSPALSQPVEASTSGLAPGRRGARWTRGFAAEAASQEQPIIDANNDSVKAMERLLSSGPTSLYFPTDVGKPKEGWEESPMKRALLWVGGYYSKESRSVRGGKLLFELVMEHAADEEVRRGLMLGDSFASRHGFISLHVWLCLTRLRQEGSESKEVQQTLYDLFQEDVEVRVRAAGVKVRISKWLTDLEQRFLGTAVSLDKALAVPDMLESKRELTEALWKNVYNAEGDKAAAVLLQRYVRRELACLAMTDSQAVLDGQIRFSSPGGQQQRSEQQ